jgi:hypothetical protein
MYEMSQVHIRISDHWTYDIGLYEQMLVEATHIFPAHSVV